jgi:hypothetical protein
MPCALPSSHETRDVYKDDKREKKVDIFGRSRVTIIGIKI